MLEMNITVKILNERETHRTMENAIARTFDVRCAIVLTSFFIISNNSSRKKSTRFPSENLFQFNPSLFFLFSRIQYLAGRPASIVFRWLRFPSCKQLRSGLN